ncbi:5'-methylthioadenosine/S-adenosylhomocysteine nucleosidase family protein [Hymenobacter persicinus]|uniref:Nucleoside phosphorylase domain-containing protein n=1 Tax=Hymenobacter persicinus TaxID=2025506 RepID=A0A4Q5LH47_9BACT|nr:hypothetical protein [Hymenobacter persicinus]RYU81263.1 hypothetical protein EWM57_06715 [Hymenobacter persicinus]
MDYRSISEDDFSKYIDLMSIVLVTVTEIEKECLHERISPLPELTHILVVQKQFYTYYLGMLGKYAVCHVESRMGTSGAGASIMTVQQAIEFVKPVIIIMVGIAFGGDETKQRIGDVLVSELVVQYENIKIKRNKIECRGFRQMSSVLLFNRFTKPIGWSFSLTKTRKSKIIYGHLLSGEKLVDDKKYRDQLLKIFEPAIGGEMEGAGLVSVAHAYNKNWLVVKGICDFADGNKAVNKIKKQYLAARAAVDLCACVFTDMHTFQDLGVIPLKEEAKELSALLKLDQVLFADSTFNSYSASKEQYYLIREIDKKYNNILDSKSNIWSYGDSGLGKTCMTFRNLIHANKKVFVIDFSSVDTEDMLSVFDYMHGRLLDAANCEVQNKPNTLMKVMDMICETLNRFYSNTYLVMEEMPIGTGKENIFKHVFSMILKNSMQYPDSTVNFCFTSIGDPKESVLSIAEKIGEKIHFMEVSEWEESDMKLLLNIMLDAIKCKLSQEYFDALIKFSARNPRKLKTGLRDLVLFAQFKDQSFEASMHQYFENKFGHVK